MITLQTIHDTIQKEILRAEAISARVPSHLLAVKPASVWAHPYKRTQIIKAKATFGRACSDGTLSISSVFVNTSEQAHLTGTVRHEIAHLIVGIHNHHNSIWQNMAIQLGCSPNRTATAHNDLAKNMKRKWRLYGTLADGEIIAFSSSHTKRSKYLGYDPQQNGYATVQGQDIMSFHYKRNV